MCTKHERKEKRDKRERDKKKEETKKKTSQIFGFLGKKTLVNLSPSSEKYPLPYHCSGHTRKKNRLIDVNRMRIVASGRNFG